MDVQTTLYSQCSLVSLPLTGGGEGAEEGRGRGEEERGVGVEGALDVCTRVQSSGPLRLILFLFRAGWNIVCRR